MSNSILEKNIVFIGFMGVGKTTIGELVAKKLGRDFIDIDKEIEREFNMKVQDIFKTFGEKVFRDKEKELVVKYCNQKSKVISLGGGAFQDDDIRRVCLANCIIFYLELSWEYWKKERLRLIIDTRPILQQLDQDEMKELFYSRKSIYSTYHSKFKIDHLDTDKASDYIVDLIYDYIIEHLESNSQHF
jgi:shikimate kinase